MRPTLAPITLSTNSRRSPTTSPSSSSPSSSSTSSNSSSHDATDALSNRLGHTSDLAIFRVGQGYSMFGNEGASSSQPQASTSSIPNPPILVEDILNLDSEESDDSEDNDIYRSMDGLEDVDYFSNHESSSGYSNADSANSQDRDMQEDNYESEELLFEGDDEDGSPEDEEVQESNSDESIDDDVYENSLNRVYSFFDSITDDVDVEDQEEDSDDEPVIIAEIIKSPSNVKDSNSYDSLK